MAFKNYNHHFCILVTAIMDVVRFVFCFETVGGGEVQTGAPLCRACGGL